MAAQDAPDLYAILGIPKDSPQEEIKRAYRKVAKEHHPDVGAEGLSSQERETRMRRMQEINEAYSVLSDPEKRKKYESLRERTRPTVEGAMRPSTNIADLFNELFGKNSIFREDFWSIWSRPRREEKDYFYFPENDLGLLVALVRAYEAKENGKWRVKRVESDKRDWLPDELYSVKRVDGKVLVYRRIVDWREEKDRGEQIRIREEGKYREDPEAVMKWNTFLGEYYLAGEGRDRLYGGLNPVPFDYGKYLGALKSLARKIANEEYDENGNIDIRAESKTINSYGEFNSKGRVEGKLLWADDESREWVRKIPLNEFWARLKTAEGTVVQVEGTAKTEEGQQKQPEVERRKPETPEGFSPSSGETESGY